MKIFEKLQNLITRLQGLPDSKKKTIVWTIAIILGLIMGIFWIGSVINGIDKINQSTKDIKLPEVNLPSLDIPSSNNNSIDNNTTPSNQ